MPYLQMGAVRPQESIPEGSENADAPRNYFLSCVSIEWFCYETFGSLRQKDIVAQKRTSRGRPQPP